MDALRVNPQRPIEIGERLDRIEILVVTLEVDRPAAVVRIDHADLRCRLGIGEQRRRTGEFGRSEEHTSELQSLMRLSYAVFCLNKNSQHTNDKAQVTHYHTTNHNQLLQPN